MHPRTKVAAALLACFSLLSLEHLWSRPDPHGSATNIGVMAANQAVRGDQLALPQEPSETAVQPTSAARRLLVPSEAASTVQGLRLSVISRGEQVPIQDAQALVNSVGQRPQGPFLARVGGTGEPNGASQIVVPQSVFRGEIEQFIVASAPGYRSRTIVWLAGMVEEVIALEPAAALTVHVVDEVGEPLAGVPLRLIPEDLGEHATAFSPHIAARSSEEEIVHSDRAGNARWDALSTERSYRWTALDGSVVRFEPPTVYRDARTDDGSLSVEIGDREARASGPINLQPHEDRRVTCVMARRGRVTGRLADALPEAPYRAVIRILHCSAPDVNAARGYRSTELEVAGYADAEGRFRFEGIRPGQKVIQAMWREAGNHMHFAKATFVMALGSTLDVGAIGRLPGAALQVNSVLRTQGGEAASIEGLPDAHREQRFALSLLSRDYEKRRDTALQEIVPLGLGETIWLHGLREGECVLEVSFAELGAGRPDWTLPRQVTLDIPEASSVDLPIVLPVTVGATVVAHFPAGEGSRVVEALIVPLEGRAPASRVQLHPTDAGHAAGSLTLGIGRYQVLVRTSSIGTGPASGDELLVGAVTAEVSATHASFEVQLDPGASVDGRTRTGVPSSEDAGEMAVGVKLPSASRGVAWTHPRVTVDAHGEFHVSGLIPMSEYVTEHGQTFTSGPVGSTQTVRLTAPDTTSQ